MVHQLFIFIVRKEHLKKYNLKSFLNIIAPNCKIIAKGTPKELINNPLAQDAYFGETFKIN